MIEAAQLRDVLGLVMATDDLPTLSDIRALPDVHREGLMQWAGAVHLGASDVRTCTPKPPPAAALTALGLELFSPVCVRAVPRFRVLYRRELARRLWSQLHIELRWAIRYRTEAKQGRVQVMDEVKAKRRSELRAWSLMDGAGFLTEAGIDVWAYARKVLPS